MLLQKYLNAHGFVVARNGAGSLGNESTYFGPATQRALISFQKANHITPAAGYFGPKTIAYMSAGNTSTPHAAATTTAPVPPQTGTIAPSLPVPSLTVFVRDLKVGMRGIDVLALQQYLNAHGFTVALKGAGAPGSESVYFGPATQRALIALQKANHILPAAGYFGPKTRNALK